MSLKISFARRKENATSFSKCLYIGDSSIPLRQVSLVYSILSVHATESSIFSILFSLILILPLSFSSHSSTSSYVSTQPLHSTSLNLSFLPISFSVISLDPAPVFEKGNIYPLIEFFPVHSKRGSVAAAALLGVKAFSLVMLTAKRLHQIKPLSGIKIQFRLSQAIGGIMMVI